MIKDREEERDRKTGKKSENGWTKREKGKKDRKTERQKDRKAERR